MFPQSKVEAYMGKQGATVPSVRMITLFWPARQFHSAKCSSPSASCTMPGMEASTCLPWPLLLLPSPIHQSIYVAPVLRTDVGGIVGKMLEMIILFEHRGLVDVVVGGYSVVVGVFREHAYVFGVIATDVHIKEHQVLIDILLAQHVLEVLLRRNKGLREAGFKVP